MLGRKIVITPIKPLEPMTGTAQLLSDLTALANHLNCAQLGLWAMSSSMTTCSLTDAWPMGPFSDGAGLNITVMSYLGTMNFGLVASREMAPDLDALAHYIGEATGELLKAVGASSSNGAGRARPKTRAGKKVAAAKAGRPAAPRAPRRRPVPTG